MAETGFVAMYGSYVQMAATNPLYKNRGKRAKMRQRNLKTL